MGTIQKAKDLESIIIDSRIRFALVGRSLDIFEGEDASYNNEERTSIFDAFDQTIKEMEALFENEKRLLHSSDGRNR